jgi:putative membrane protein
MIRRSMLGVLATYVVSGPVPARAQGSPQAEGRMRNEAGEGVVSSQPAPASEMQAQMLGGMAFALATAQLAERTAENPAVRLFGQLEAEEQTAFMAARQMAGLRVPTVELMREDQRQMMIRMRDMRGPEFDRAFLRAQVQGHQDLLRLHQAAAQNPTGREEGMLATVAIPPIRTHLVMLEGIQRSMGG